MKHQLDINLDDPIECNEFIENHGTIKGRRLANKLGLSGQGSSKLASALSNYAWNKQTAMSCRISGKIAIAQQYETICDRIYSQDIAPNCDCW